MGHFEIRRQVVIRDSVSFRDAIRLWRTVYENEISTPREIKRFINELRYKAIRFRGPVQKVGLLHEAAVERPELLHEATLIALAILDRLGMGQYAPREAVERLPMTYGQTLRDHISRFGEPTNSDWERYRSLFGPPELLDVWDQ